MNHLSCSFSPKKLTILTCIALLCTYASLATRPGKIHNKHYKFRINLPDQMRAIDNPAASWQQLYYDTVADIILTISARDSKFHSVNNYISCSQQDLEHKLRYDFGDSTLKLISCVKSEYYPKKTIALNFSIASLPFGYDTYMAYFIHHRQKDIQLFFTYKNTKAKSSMDYINAVMRTLKLK